MGTPALSPSLYKEEEICCWDDLYDFYRKKLSIDKDGKEIDQDWMCRGQRNTDWKLQTSLERACKSFVGIDLSKAEEIEKKLIYEFSRRYHLYTTHIPNQNDTLEWLTLMQHHGAPTRLLDWTYSFFVAVYFAFEDAHEENSESGSYAVWCINNKWLQLEVGKKFHANGIKRSTIKQYAETRDGKSFDKIFRNDNPKPLVCPVNPLRYNERLTIQQGVFLCPGDVRKPFEDNLVFLNEANNVQYNFYKLTLMDKDGSFRKAALRHLNRMNMNRATLFPGLDGFAQSLRTQLTRLADLPPESLLLKGWDRAQRSPNPITPPPNLPLPG